MYIFENLRKNDLDNLIKDVFEIDSYKSKIGNDYDITVLSFTLKNEDAAKDLENFIEMGYSFIIDADVSEGETDDGVYKVFVEIERNRHIADQIYELLQGIEKLANDTSFRFRYYKSFKSHDATLENLKQYVPVDKESYERAINQSMFENFSNFFANSFVDDVQLVNESIVFKKNRADSLKFNIVNSGLKKDVYESIKGKLMLESKDVAEILFYTKYIGNYNITKIADTYIFENKHWAVALKRA